mmetsp:Transcript_21215/g.69479  ORF Transcript_21215/g.69479 Transcript_21215/m.69479 type:complete len:211 (-) Transcript_21215:13-645(-)
MRKDLADEGGDEVKALHRVERLRRAHAVAVHKLERVVPLSAERHALDHAEAAAAAQLALQLVALLDKPAAHLERERVALQPLAGCSHELEHSERLRRIGSLPQPPQELRPSRRQQVPEEVLAAPPGLESSLVALALPVQHRQVERASAVRRQRAARRHRRRRLLRLLPVLRLPNRREERRRRLHALQSSAPAAPGQHAIQQQRLGHLADN